MSNKDLEELMSFELFREVTTYDTTEEHIVEYLELWIDEMFNAEVDSSDKYHLEIANRITKIQAELEEGKFDFCDQTILLAEKVRKALRLNSGLEESEPEDEEDEEEPDIQKDINELEELKSETKKKKKGKVAWEDDPDTRPKFTMDEDQPEHPF